MHDSGVLVISEELRLIGKGRELADTLGVFLSLLAPREAQSRTLFQAGADRIYRGEPSDPKVILKVIRKSAPEIVLAPSSGPEADAAIRAAHGAGAGLVSGCVALTIDTEERMLVATRPILEGRLIEEIGFTRRPQFALIAVDVLAEPFLDESRESGEEEAA